MLILLPSKGEMFFFTSLNSEGSWRQVIVSGGGGACTHQGACEDLRITSRGRFSPCTQLRQALTVSAMLNTPSSLAWIPGGDSPLSVSHLTAEVLGSSVHTIISGFDFLKYAFWESNSGHQVCPVFLSTESSHRSLDMGLSVYI